MTRNKTLLMVAVLAALGAGTALADPQTAADSGKRPTLDKNGDGFIDRSEAAAHPRLAEHFDALDKNKDGKLGADEMPRHHGGPRGDRDGHGPGERMKQLDTNHDGRISRAEAAAQPGFAERFDRMDANHDGFVDQADRELLGKQRRDEWFARADTDRDGKLSRSEFDAAEAQRREGFGDRMHARGAQRFAALDTNHDGRISREEAKKDPRLAERFDQLDSNKDGVLVQDEMKPRPPR